MKASKEEGLWQGRGVRIAWCSLEAAVGYAGSLHCNNERDIERAELGSLECYLTLQEPPHAPGLNEKKAKGQRTFRFR